MKLIAATDDSYGIGKDGEIPWNVSGDFQFFKSMTYGETLLVGRKTFENIKGLPHRKFIVLTSSNTKTKDPTVTYVNSFRNATLEARDDKRDVWVAGGQSIYDYYTGKVRVAFVSHIPGNYECDTFFPEEKLKSDYVEVATVPAQGFEFTRYDLQS